MKGYLYWIPLLLTACLVSSSCSNDLVQGADSPNKVFTLTVDALKGGQTTTRGLTDGLAAVWSEGDVVTVMKGGSLIGVMTPQTTGSASTRLTAQLTSMVEMGDQLTLVFPRSERSYTGQKGTLADIAQKYDYATADVTVRYVNGANASTTDANFVNQQAIVRFSLTDGTSPLSVNSLTISADGLRQNATATGLVTITLVSATSEIYAALSGVNGPVTLNATTASQSYSYTTSGSKTWADGKFYSVTVKMKTDADPMLSSPLTLEATVDDTQITFVNQAEGDVQFSRNQAEWTTIPSGQPGNMTIDAGEKIYFRGNNASYYPGSYASSVTCSAPCYIYGNIMSLVNATAFESLASLPEGENTFRSLFEGNTNIRNHPQNELLLPATTIQPYCYQRMFAGCTGLTKAPALPASTLRAYCYLSMFEGCLNLAYIKCLATNIDATDCTLNWVSDVCDTGTFVKAAAMTSWPAGTDGIPYGWTITEE